MVECLRADDWDPPTRRILYILSRHVGIGIAPQAKNRRVRQLHCLELLRPPFRRPANDVRVPRRCIVDLKRQSAAGDVFPPDVSATVNPPSWPQDYVLLADGPDSCVIEPTHAEYRCSTSTRHKCVVGHTLLGRVEVLAACKEPGKLITDLIHSNTYTMRSLLIWAEISHGMSSAKYSVPDTVERPNRPA